VEKLFLILLYFTIAIGSVYFILIASYCYGWIKTRSMKLNSPDPVFVSIIIAARNEENNIANCLNAIIKQSYPVNKFEIIVVDDVSADSTNEIVRKYAENHSNIRVVALSGEGDNKGKKFAVKSGMEKSQGELIVTTDADCTMGENWLSSIVAFYLETNAKMIVGPVCYQNERTVFEKMQSLEFMALMACGGGSLYYNKAIMSNGANLAYSKEAFDEVKGFEGIEDKASGDDVLLMYKFKNKYPEGLKFLKMEESVVYTEAKHNLKEFVQQRKRWASKGFAALNIETKVVSLLVYCFNFLLVAMPLFGTLCLRNTDFYPVFIEFCLILILIKCFIDFLLLFLSASFFKKKKLLIYFLPEQVVYMMYVIIIGLIGTIGKYEWKGRQIK
jgi:cellulose synthase/poly-beta-1,6-N-acetylglucosamine synthase-like glycosyltransferase